MNKENDIQQATEHSLKAILAKLEENPKSVKGLETPFKLSEKEIKKLSQLIKNQLKDSLH